MVRRASSTPHLNNSGASSADSVTNRGRAGAPVRAGAGKRATGSSGSGSGGKAATPRQSSGSSGSSRVPRSRSLTNGMRRLSPQKGGSSGGAGGTGGSSRNTPYFLRSRENE